MTDVQTLIDRPVNVVAAVVFVDSIAMVLARNNLAGKVINDWYNQFTLGAFVADVGSICFGIFLSLALFKYVLPAGSFTLGTFVISVVLIQLLHDLLFGQLIMGYPKHQNRMMDLFKKYVDENSWKILLVDGAMMALSAVIIYYLAKKNVNKVIMYAATAFLLYVAQFLIY